MKAKKLQLTLLFVLISSSANIFAQWKVYDGSYFPSNPGTGQESFITSDTNGYGTPLSTVVDDPSIASNKLLKIDDTGLVGTGIKESWRPAADVDFDVDLNGITVIVRAKPAVYNGGTTRYFYLSIRNGVYDVQFTVFSDATEFATMQLNNISPVSDKIPLNNNGWNIYRVTVKGDAINVYLNEKTTPVFTATAFKTSTSRYFKFGDDSSSASTMSSLIDWVIWDDKGAYAPGTGNPIPSNLSTKSNDPTTGILDTEVNNNIKFNAFPTKFMDATTLSFNLENATNTKITAYNAAGFKVKEVLNQKLSVGNHSVVFNGAGIPAGLYFFVIEANGQTNSIKTLLTK